MELNCEYCAIFYSYQYMLYFIVKWTAHTNYITQCLKYQHSTLRKSALGQIIINWRLCIKPLPSGEARKVIGQPAHTPTRRLDNSRMPPAVVLVVLITVLYLVPAAGTQSGGLPVPAAGNILTHFYIFNVVLIETSLSIRPLQTNNWCQWQRHVHILNTSSSAIAERPCSACSTSNRKPLNLRLKGYVSSWSLWTVR